MAKVRKNHDIVLPEVRKPAGMGKLIAVIKLNTNRRELWFQHEDNTTIRCVKVNLSTGTATKPIIIKTKGERAR
jgi:hypothetical protein